MSHSFERVRKLVSELETLGPEERDQRLAELGDEDLEREVRSVLKHADGSDFPTVPNLAEALDALTDSPRASETPDSIGRYRILRELGRGGMGTVYEAEQDVPQRRVALKCIRADLVSSQVVRRFMKETEILGLLQHPGIAQIYDAGLSDAGLGPEPFIAMELVEGMNLLDFAREKQLTTRARLELFVKICDAVQHAHQKGIIHRDLKPENILVKELESTTQRGSNAVVGQPVVLDFGIARITDGDIARATQETEAGSLIGTLAYMSPEQTSGKTTELDTRSDIYALGVILFELLAERLPIDVADASILEAVVRIQQDEPTRLGSVDRAFRGDLETIVARALEKEPRRRYSSASELGGDVSRFLASEPILARPQTSLYQLGKFVRRNKGLTVGLAGMFVAVAVGFVVSTSLFFKAKKATEEAEATNETLTATLVERDQLFQEEQRQRTLAEDNEKRAREAEGTAQEESARALREEERAETRSAQLALVNDFQSDQLAGINVPLMGARLRESIVREAPEDDRSALSSSLEEVNFTDVALQTLAENLFAPSIEAIDRGFDEEPVIQAHLLMSVATSLRELGLLEMAVSPQTRSYELRREAFGDDHIETLESRIGMALLMSYRGDYSEADSHAREALARLRPLAEQHPDEYLAALSTVGRVAMRLGNLEVGAEMLRESIDFSREHPEVGSSHLYRALSRLATILKLRGELEEAEAVCREAIRGFSDTELDPSAYRQIGLGPRLNLGTILTDQGRLEEAEVLFREELHWVRGVYGDDHRLTITVENNLANALQDQGKLEEAAPFYRSAVAKAGRLLGPKHSWTLLATYNLGVLMHDLGNLPAAEELFTEAWTELPGVFSPTHPALRDVASNFEELLRERLELAQVSSEQPRLSEARLALGSLLAERGNFTEAELLLTEAATWALDTDAAGAVEIVEKTVEMYEAWHATAPAEGYDIAADEWAEALR